MKLNKSTIKHYRCEIIPEEVLKTKITLSETQIKKKNTWYEIDGKLQYFKIRNDFRLFTELFFSKFAREIMDLNTLSYKVTHITTNNPVTSKIGLLSENFQNSNYNHYLISELMNSKISNFIAYGGYTLESLLNFFRDYLTKECYEENEIFLIKLFICDGFTYNVDRNPDNISFRIPKSSQTSYKDKSIKKSFHHNSIIEYNNEQEKHLIADLTPNVVFDNERILGVDHKNVLSFNHTNCWSPLLAYNNEVNFTKLEINQAQQIKDQIFDGFDPNLLYLYINHQKICTPYFERLAFDDEYKKILESFTNTTGVLTISDKEKDYVLDVLQTRQKEFKKILKF